MVFEQLFSVKWMERKEHAFVMGLLYTLVSIGTAWLIFPASVGIVSIAFTSILIIPSLNVLLKLEENVEVREKKLSVTLLFKDHKDIFKVYMWLFLGIFCGYFLFSLILPTQLVESLFGTQLKATGAVGFAFNTTGLMSMLSNNFLILLVCMLLSLAYGAGAIFFLSWNASVWAVFFAYAFRGTTDISVLAFILPVLPHMITEALAYISASIAGGVMSKAAIREKFMSKKFMHIATDALIMLGIGALLVLIAGIIENALFF